MLCEEFLETIKLKPAAEKGLIFQNFIKKVLRHIHPIYKSQIVDIYQPPGKDTGVDLVATLKDGSKLAIQCKFWENKVSWNELSTFVASLSLPEFRGAKGMVVAPGGLTREAEKKCQEMGITVITDICSGISDIDANSPENIKLLPKKVLRDYQRDAVEHVLKGFESADRGKLIMPPGSGKTFTALKIAERMVPDGGYVLFVVPSIALLDQTLRSWAVDAERQMRFFAVVSDKDVGKGEDSFVLEIPASTKPEDLIKAGEKFDGITVVFSTYQSLDVVKTAQEKGYLPAFDLIIADEAHRTASVSVNKGKDSPFHLVHYGVIGRKRLYMTATPRIYEPDVKKTLDEYDIDFYSMDDEQTYGETFYQMTFREAVDKGIITDYKVIVFSVDKNGLQGDLYNFLKEHPDLTLDDLSRAYVVLKTMQGKLIDIDNAPLEVDFCRAIAFTGRVKESKALEKMFTGIFSYTHPLRQQSSLFDGLSFSAQKELCNVFSEEETSKKVALIHLDGTNTAREKKIALDWLRKKTEDDVVKVISNAKVLTEGIDVPALDAIIFLKPRDSVVDIIQALGRAVRRAPGKSYGYVVVPLIMDSNEDITEESWRTLWQLLEALRSVDDAIEAKIRKTIVVRPSERKNASGSSDNQIVVVTPPQQTKLFPIIRSKIIPRIAKRLGLTRKYLENWAEEVAKMAKQAISYFKVALERDEEARKKTEDLVKAFSGFLNESVSLDTVLQTAVQYAITKPVFEALFSKVLASRNDPVAEAMDRFVEHFKTYLEKEIINKLKSFYDRVQTQAQGLAESEYQDFMRRLYDSFFSKAFKNTADEMGIAYTPVEIVDFIVKSADFLAKKHFNASLGDKGVVIFEPFAGTGTFLARLVNYLDAEKLKAKLERKEIWGNEILLLPYYIMRTNVESEYLKKTGEFKPFDTSLWTDSFNLMEKVYKKLSFDPIPLFPERYSELLNAQLKARVNVIISNPPWRAGKENENVGSRNVVYPELRKRIEITYAKCAKKLGVKLVNSLYDLYIHAIRMATDRIDEGVIGFVLNNGWLDGFTGRGVRKALSEEFEEIYVYNLRGNARKSGELWRKEGDKVFGNLSRAGVCVLLLVKKKKTDRKATIYYYQVKDYLKRHEKLNELREYGDVSSVPWQVITPDENYDWIEQGEKEFESFIPIVSKKGQMGIFKLGSLGVITGRDAFCFNFSYKQLEQNMKRLIGMFNEHLDRKNKHRKEPLESWIEKDETLIKWDRTLRQYFERDSAQKQTFDSAGKVYNVYYRPFVKMHLYLSKIFNNMTYQITSIFPRPNIQNIAIAITGRGSNEFGAWMVDRIVDRGFSHVTNLFPLYTYPKSQGNLALGNQKQCNITESALKEFRKIAPKATPEDVFYYVFGIINSQEYQQKYRNNLKKSLPRIPLPDSKEQFEKIRDYGRAVADLELNWENLEPYPLDIEIASDAPSNKWELYQIDKMRLKEKEGKLIYNEFITIKGIPQEVFNLKIAGKHPLKYVVDYYKRNVKAKGKHPIIWDPNDVLKEAGDPEYLIKLIGKVVRFAVEFGKICSRVGG